MEDFNPSRCEIIKAVISSHKGDQSIDVSANFIGQFKLQQSMLSVAYSGSCFVLDTQGILESFPLRGEEKMDLHIKSFDTQYVTRLQVRIFKISDIQPANNSDSVSYTMHFISDTSFKASLNKVTAPFKTSINRAAREIFNKYFCPIETTPAFDTERGKILPFATARFKLSDQSYPKNFFITPTVGLSKFIVPDLTPSEAMYFIAARGYNPETPSQTFRFFETFNNYYFTTDEFFIKDPEVTHDLFFAPDVPNDPANQFAAIQRVEELSVLSKGIDSSMDVASGSYRNHVIEVDLMRRNFSTSKFNFDNAKYYDMSGDRRDNTSNPHTDKFREDAFTDNNAKKFMVFRNYSRPGDIPSNLNIDRHLADIAHNRVSYYHHLNNTSLALTLKGRLDINPGDMINLDMKALESDDQAKNNNSLSGRYLVQAAVYDVDEASTLTTLLKVVKFDWDTSAKPVETRDIPAAVIGAADPNRGGPR